MLKLGPLLTPLCSQSHEVAPLNEGAWFECVCCYGEAVFEAMVQCEEVGGRGRRGKVGRRSGEEGKVGTRSGEEGKVGTRSGEEGKVGTRSGEEGEGVDVYITVTMLILSCSFSSHPFPWLHPLPHPFTPGSPVLHILS